MFSRWDQQGFEYNKKWYTDIKSGLSTSKSWNERRKIGNSNKWLSQLRECYVLAEKWTN